MTRFAIDLHVSSMVAHLLVKDNWSAIEPTRGRLFALLPLDTGEIEIRDPAETMVTSEEASRTESFSACCASVAFLFSRARAFVCTSSRAQACSPGTLHAHGQSLMVAVTSFFPEPSLA